MKTIFPTQINNNQRKWYLIDAEGQTLGRLATKIAVLLKGKDKVDFAPHLDNGSYVVVINSEKVAVTGNKEEDKEYVTHSGFMGGIKTMSVKEKREKNPTDIIKLAVKGMLPKSRLRDGMLARLKLQVGATHDFDAQKPETIKL